jgi:Opioid growth factor receptor (OGFr) conserved region
MKNQELHPIIGFYSGKSTDYQGRNIRDIWNYNDQQLEFVHDYIQWLFPLKQKSIFNRSAPTLDDQVIATFKNNRNLQKNLFISLQLMLTFYGLKIEDNRQIIKADNYGQIKKRWITLRNHNYLRITRILTSLKLLGLEKFAIALFNCLEKIYTEESEIIGSKTFNYWQNAIKKY